jgi:hypothetical protein
MPVDQDCGLVPPVRSSDCEFGPPVVHAVDAPDVASLDSKAFVYAANHFCYVSSSSIEVGGRTAVAVEQLSR